MTDRNFQMAPKNEHVRPRKRWMDCTKWG